MMFNAFCDNIPTSVLLDTGAGANFMDAETATRFQATIEPTSAQHVKGASNHTLNIQGKTTATIRLGQYTTSIDFYIIPRILPGVDLVLGKRWQRLNRVIINCGKWIKVRPEMGINYKIYPTISQEEYKSHERTRPTDIMEMSEKKARKAIRRGAPYYMLLIRKISSPDTGAKVQGPAPQSRVVISNEGVPPQADHLDERSTERAVSTDNAGLKAVGRKGDAWTDDLPQNSESPMNTPTTTTPTTRDVEISILDPAELEDLRRELSTSVLSPELPSDPEAYRPPDEHQHVIRTEAGAHIPKRQYRRLSPVSTHSVRNMWRNSSTRDTSAFWSWLINKFSKMVHLAPGKKTIIGKECADLFRDNVIKHHGVPRKLITDRDTRFRGKFMDALTASLGITQALSTAFHPQSDGQTERMNQLVEDVMRNYVSAIQTDWDEWLAHVEFAINNAYNASIKTTPFRMVYGRDPLTPFTVQLPTQVDHAKFYLQDNILRAERARYFLQAATERQKKYADQKRRDMILKVDDMVLLSTKNLAIKADGTKKFYPRFVGPFKVTRTFGKKADAPDYTPTAARLDLPPNCRIHPVFHVSLLRPFVPPELTTPRVGD